MGSNKVLALIPAKAGSTRFPRKNIALLQGRTLLEWAGLAIKNSGVEVDIVVSSESQEIRQLAIDLGYDAPFKRPDSLARDPAGVVHVLEHAIKELSNLGRSYDIAIICLPTCPLRSPEDVRAAFELFMHTKQTVMSVSMFSHTPFAAMKRSSEGFMEPWFPEFWGRKSQEMPEAYRPNGAVHVVSVEHLLSTGSMLGPPVIGYVMPYERSIDIDNECDLAEANAYMIKTNDL